MLPQQLSFRDRDVAGPPIEARHSGHRSALLVVNDRDLRPEPDQPHIAADLATFIVALIVIDV
jgi:hypothetical protein